MDNDNKQVEIEALGKMPLPSSHARVRTCTESGKCLHYASKLFAALEKNEITAFNKRIETKGHLIFYNQQE